MIGLHRRKLTIAEPHPGWVALFKAERLLLAKAIGEWALQIEHIGSTAVPGLAAKPIIDIGILVARAEDIAGLGGHLASIGYIDRGDKGDKGGHLYVRELSTDYRTHHLHILVRGDPAWDRYLRFRDILRQSPDICQKYAALKRDLVERFGDDRSSYGGAKTEFVFKALQRD